MTDNLTPGQIASFKENDSFPDTLNTTIVDELKKLDLTHRNLRIVMPGTEPIVRPTGSAVLYNHDEVEKRLAGWPDLRVQKYGNPKLDIAVHNTGFDITQPISAMIVMVTEDKDGIEEPVFVRSVILQSPEYLKEEKYLVREQREGKTVYVIRNATQALGIDESTYVITPGWSYIMPGKRAGEEGSEGITNIKDLSTVTRTIVKILNDQLVSQGLKTVIVSQQDGDILNFDAELPQFYGLDFGTEIDPEEVDDNGNKRWYFKPKDSTELVSIFDYFGIGGDESKATAHFARISKMGQLQNVAHIVENGMGPVFKGDPANYGAPYTRNKKIEG